MVTAWACGRIAAGRADVDWATLDGRTPVSAAAGEGHGDVVEYLVAAGANVNTTATRGTTPLEREAATATLAGRGADDLASHLARVQCSAAYGIRGDR